MRFISVALLLCVILITSGCSAKDTPPTIHGSPSPPNSNTKAKYTKISAEEARKIMDESKEYILLDVRTEEEFKEERIAGAILIPDYEIESRAEAELLDKDTQILIYCRSGRRSANAAQALVDLGYTNVYDMGGIIDWTYDTIIP